MEKESVLSVISADMEIVGTVKTAGSVRVDGKIEGELISEKDVQVSKHASIKGDVSIHSVLVEGTVNGNITASDRVELKSLARVVGDIRARRLVMEEGVSFSGKMEVNPSAESAPADAAKELPISGEARADAVSPAAGVRAASPAAKTAYFNKR